MAVLHKDSFDHYTTLSDKWTFGAAGNMSISSGNGRNGTNSLRTTYDNAGVAVSHAQLTTLIAGVAFKIPTTLPAGQCLLGYCVAATNYVQISVVLNTSKRIEIRRGNSNETIIATADAVLTVGWHYIEFKAYIHDSAGTTEVHIDGVEVPELTLTEQDTKNKSESYADLTKIALGTAGSSQTFDWDDFYLCDTSGSYCNDFLGDVRVEARLADGPGDSVNTDWTPSAGDNYDCVNENPPNSDTDYVSSDNPGDIDTYAFAALATTAGTVKAATVWLYARKDDAGTREVAAVARHDTSEAYGDTKTLGGTYAYYGHIFHVNPSTTNPWTIAEINEAEFGEKLIT